MANRYALIDDATNTWAGSPYDAEPVPTDGQRVVLVSLLYPDRAYWSPLDGGGFAPIVATPLISVGRFKLLFTQAERIRLRGAATQDPHVADFLDLLAGFTDGVGLSDPVMTAAIDQLQAGGLLTPDRAAAILAGQAPS